MGKKGGKSGGGARKKRDSSGKEQLKKAPKVVDQENNEIPSTTSTTTVNETITTTENEAAATEPKSSIPIPIPKDSTAATTTMKTEGSTNLKNQKPEVIKSAETREHADDEDDDDDMPDLKVDDDSITYAYEPVHQPNPPSGKEGDESESSSANDPRKPPKSDSANNPRKSPESDSANNLQKSSESSAPIPQKSPGSSAPNPQKSPESSTANNPKKSPGSAAPNPQKSPESSTATNPQKSSGSSAPNPQKSPGSSTATNPQKPPQSSAPNPQKSPGSSSAPNPQKPPQSSAPNPQKSPKSIPATKSDASSTKTENKNSAKDSSTKSESGKNPLPQTKSKSSQQKKKSSGKQKTPTKPSESSSCSLKSANSVPANEDSRQSPPPEKTPAADEKCLTEPQAAENSTSSKSLASAKSAVVEVPENGILRELRFPDPYVWSVEAEMCKFFCNYCMRAPKPPKTTLCRCSACKFAHFCDSVCQRAGWEFHKLECGRLRKCYPKAPTTVALFYGRLIDRLLADKVKIDYEIDTPEDGMRNWGTLMTHSEEMRQNAERIYAYFELIKEMKEFYGGEKPVSDSDMWIVFCKKSVNTHGVFNYKGDCIGPTLSIDFDGKCVILKSLSEDLDVRDIKRAFISYSELMIPKYDRKKHLRDNYFFECACVRCTNPEDDKLAAFRCMDPACKEGAVYYPGGDGSASVCDVCGTRANDRFVQHAESLFCEIPDKIQEKSYLSKEDKDNIFKADKELEAIEQLIEEAQEYLHPLNSVLNDLMVEYFQKAIETRGNYTKAMQYSRLTLPCFRLTYAPSHKKLGFHLLRICLLEIKTHQCFALHSWQSKAEKALRIFRAWYGEGHIFVQNVSNFLAVINRLLKEYGQEPGIPPEEEKQLLESLRFYRYLD